jgi:hypothetical protein
MADIVMNKFKSIYNDENIFYALLDPVTKSIEGENYIEVTASLPNVKPQWVKQDAVTKVGKVVVRV